MRTAAIIFRMLNRLNPTSYGRFRVIAAAQKLGCIPEDGVYTIEHGIKMEFSFGDFIEQAIYFDAFEYMIRRTLMKRFRRSLAFLDIGANIGYYSILASKLMPSGGVIYSVEANPKTLRALRKNIELNSISNVNILPFAAYDNEGAVDILMPIDGTHGSASLRNQGWGEICQFRVPSRRLDRQLSNVKVLDLIKIDIEGAEMQALKGAEALLKAHKPTVIVEIVPSFLKKFGTEPRNVFEFLLDMNPKYRVWEIKEHSLELCIGSKMRSPEYQPRGNFLFAAEA